jgi:rSAM/selenodomain-associated transferase 1
MEAGVERMRTASTLIIVFAKAPQAGRVKTRLAATLGDAGAAKLHARLVDRTVRMAVAADCGPVELHGAPASHSFLRALALRYAIALRPQADGDVGKRMYGAFRKGLRMHRRVILIGSDCPTMNAADLRRAARLLRGCDAIFAPAEDGGYPLIGLARNSPSLFDGVAWGTSKVMEQTRERLGMLGWRWQALRMLWDVDRPADLARLKTSGLLQRRP